MPYTFNTSENDAGRRLDRILRTRWPQVPLGRIMGALRKGEVLLDGKPAEPSIHPEEGQEIFVPWEAPRIKEPGTGRADLSFVFEGKAAWVLDKPAGLLVQPAGPGNDSLIGRVWNRFPDSADGFRPSAVNRLDRNTSGLVTVALSGPALRALQEAWRARLVKKTYLAVVLGETPSSGRIDVPIKKDPAKNRVDTAPDGEPALTHFVKVIGDLDSRSEGRAGDGNFTPGPVPPCLPGFPHPRRPEIRAFRSKPLLDAEGSPSPSPSRLDDRIPRAPALPGRPFRAQPDLPPTERHPGSPKRERLAGLRNGGIISK